jgi:hypothetical protein
MLSAFWQPSFQKRPYQRERLSTFKLNWIA